MEEKLINERNELYRLAEEDFKAANANFAEVTKGNFLVATAAVTILGILIASIERELSLCTKIIIVTTITAFCSSLILGVMQFITDYIHTRRWGKFRTDMADKISDGLFSNYEDYYNYQSNQKLNTESFAYFAYIQTIASVIGITGSAVLLILFVI